MNTSRASVRSCDRPRLDHLGSAVETRDVEVVHALGTVAVGVGGVGVAGLTAYLLGPTLFAATSTSPGLSISLALIASLSFTLVLLRD